MHKQFTATRDIKFPDSKQYMKFGDVLLFDDMHKTMSIYRNGSLIGTVPFSSSGLQEFLRLGWILDPSKDKRVVVVQAPAPLPAIQAAEAVAAVMLLDDTVGMDVQDRLIQSTEPKRKKKEKVADEA